MAEEYRVYRNIAIALGVVFFAFASLFVYVGLSKLSEADDAPAKIKPSEKPHIYSLRERIAKRCPENNDLESDNIRGNVIDVELYDDILMVQAQRVQSNRRVIYLVDVCTGEIVKEIELER